MPYGILYATFYGSPYAMPYGILYATFYGSPYAMPYGILYAKLYENPFYGILYAKLFYDMLVSFYCTVNKYNSQNENENIKSVGSNK